MSNPHIPTPDFETYSLTQPVVKAATTEGVVRVTWSDGSLGRFHFMWLRDNCACSICLDSNSRERLYSILDLPEDIHPLSVSISHEGGLRVVWSDQAHQSHYHPGWLRHFCYSEGHNQPETRCIKTWDRRLEQNIPLFQATAVMENEAVHYDFLTTIQQLGLAIVTEVDQDIQTFERLANCVGLLRDINWGKIFEIVTTPKGEYIANRSHALPPHSDAATREYMPGLQIFQCVENTASGGESMWVDGYHIAHLLRTQYPEDYALLTQTPWEQANRAKETHYRWGKPIITLDENGDVLEIRDTTWLREPLQADFETVPKLYQAYRRYSALIAARENQVERKLVEGEVAFIDNRRVLHGRRSFDSSKGRRHIRTSYSEREELLSSIRLIERGVSKG